MFAFAGRSNRTQSLPSMPPQGQEGLLFGRGITYKQWHRREVLCCSASHCRPMSSRWSLGALSTLQVKAQEIMLSLFGKLTAFPHMDEWLISWWMNYSSIPLKVNTAAFPEGSRFGSSVLSHKQQMHGNCNRVFIWDLWEPFVSQNSLVLGPTVYLCSPDGAICSLSAFSVSSSPKKKWNKLWSNALFLILAATTSTTWLTCTKPQAMPATTTGQPAVMPVPTVSSKSLFIP